MAISETSVSVLHVDDEPDFAEMTAEYLELEDSRFEVTTATGAEEALEILGDKKKNEGSEENDEQAKYPDGEDIADVDCIVSDYSMPGTDGLELLEEVRDEYHDLPFILFTGKGSEEVASEAISAGVTDYLQKEPGTEQYTVLANRIQNAVNMSRSKQELRETSKKLRAVLDTVSAGVFMKDTEGRYMLMNQNCREMLGVEDDVTGMTDYDILPDETAEMMREGDRLVLEEGKTIEVEEEFPSSDGSRIYLTLKSPVLDDDGEPYAVCGVSTDITERREREKELMKQQRMLDTVLSNVPIVMFALDEDGVFTRSRGKALEEIGLEPGEAVGESVFDMYEDEEILDQIERALEGESVKATVENSGRIFETWYEPLGNGDGSATGVVGLSYDITEIEKREKELERYEAIVENTSDLVTLVEEDGTILYQSPSTRRVLGYDHEDAVGNNIFEYVHIEDRGHLMGEFSELLEDPEHEVGDAEYRFKHVDGSNVWLSSSITDRTDTELGGFLIVSRDVTKRKESEEELRMLKERLDLAVEGANLGIWDRDIEAGKVTYNDRFLEILGMSEDEAEHDLEFWEERVHPEDAEALKDGLKQHFKGETERYDIEYRIRTAGGDWKWLRSMGHVVERGEDGRAKRTVGVHMDIDEGKEREDVLERYETFVEKSSDVLTHVDEDGTVLYQSPAVENVFGYKHGETVGDNVFEYAHPDDQEMVMEEFYEIMNSPERDTGEIEFRARAADGSYIWVEAIGTDHRGTETGGFVVNMRDITERKEREKELELYEALVENTTDLMTLIEEDGTILYQSPSAETVLGYDAENATGYNVFDYVHPDNRDYVEELVSGMMGDPEVEFDESEYRFRRADGSYIWLEGSIVDRRDTDLGGFLIVARDVTERKEREKELERYEAYIKNSSDSITHLDEDGKIVYRKPSTERAENEPEGMEGTKAFEHVHPDDEQRVREAFEGVLNDPDTDKIRLEYRSKRADGTYEWVETVATNQTETEVSGVIANTRVIEERKKREKELERYESFIENSSDLITHLDKDGTILYQSPSVERILGHGQDERVGDNCFEYVHPDDRERALKKFENMLDGSIETVEEVDIRYERADGSYVWFEVIGTDQRDTEAGGIVINSRDITERKRYEEELERSQGLLKGTEQIADTGGWEADLETGEVRWTTGMYEIFDVSEGYQPSLEESIENYHPEDRDTVRQAIQKCREEGEPFEEELRIAQGDDVLWVHVRGEPVSENGEVTGIRGSVRDITEMKEREKELERSQDLLHKTERISDTGGWEVDFETGEHRWTEGTYRIHGVSDDYEPTAEKDIEFYHPDDREAITEAVERCREEGEPYDEELRLITANGDLRWVRASGEPVYEGNDIVKLRGSIRDITEEKERETELLRNNMAVRELYEITADPDVSFEDKIEMVLESCRSRLGLPYGFVTEIDTETETQNIEYARGTHELLQPGESCPLEQSYCRKTLKEDGLLAVQDAANEGWEGDEAYEKFGLGCYIGAKLTVGDELYGTLCFADTEPCEDPFTDFERTLVELMANWVSYELERKTSEERLRRQKERLDDFASVVSHDLRSPLAVLRGNLQLAEETGDPDHFGSCRNAVDRMEAIIEDLLSLARDVDETGEVEPVDIGEVVDGCWRNIDTKEAKLRVETESSIMADKGKLRQMFENLLRNSVEHGGDEVTVTVTDLPDGFRLEDNGSGISEEERERIFEPGYTTGEGGTGLGMYIAKQVAELHGWELEATEGEEGGAAFEVTGVEKV